ncbi:MAG TPA: ester cyclase [Anaeromyxobacter sp.]
MTSRSLVQLTLVVITTATACASAGGATTTEGRSPPMATHTHRSNKEIVRSVYEDSLNTGNWALLDELIAPDFAGVRGGVGPAGFARTIEELRAAFPDIHYTIEDLVAEGDRVAIRWTWTGTHKGRYRGFAPTENSVSNTGFAIFQLRDGKLSRSWLETDRFGFVHQIGGIPQDLIARLQPGPAK